MKSNNLDDGYTSKQFLSKLLSKNYDQQKAYSCFKVMSSVESQNQSLKQKDFSPQQKLGRNIYFNRVMSPKNVEKQNIQNGKQSIMFGYEKYHSQKLIQQNKYQKLQDQKHFSSSTISSEIQFNNQDQKQYINKKNENLNTQQSVIVQKTILFLKNFLKGKLINQQDFCMLDELEKNIFDPFKFDKLLQKTAQNKTFQKADKNEKTQKLKQKTNNKRLNIFNCENNQKKRPKSFTIFKQNTSQMFKARNYQSLLKKSQDTEKNIKKKKTQCRELFRKQIKSIKDVLDKNLISLNKRIPKFQ